MDVLVVGLIVLGWTAATVAVGWLGVRWAVAGGARRVIGVVLIAAAAFANPIVNLPAGFVVREFIVADVMRDGVTTDELDARFGPPVELVEADGVRLAQRRHAIGPWYALWPTQLVADMYEDGSVRGLWLD